MPVREIKEPGFRVSVVYNPLDVSDRADVEMLLIPGRTILDYLEGLPGELEWEVALNGAYIPKEGWHLTFPKENDHLVVAPVPEGGGNGKSVLAIVGMIALSIASPILAGAFFAQGTLGYALMTAAVNIAGGLLINALIPRPEQNIEGADAQSYGIDGPKNTSTEGVPVPILYGEHAFGGNFVDLYTENTLDASGEEVQYLYARVLVSEGPIEEIREIFLNDQPLANFTDIEWDHRLGTPNQSVSPWFANTVTLFTQDAQITQTPRLYTTSGEVDRIRLDFLLPAGLYSIDGRGRRQERSVAVTIRIRPVGSPTWTFVDGVNIREKQASAIRRTWLSPTLAEGVYEIEWSRTTPEADPADNVFDQVRLADVGEIVNDDVALVNSAWVGIKAKITGQFSQIPVITGIARGRQVPIYDQLGNVALTAWSNNPADVALDIYTNLRYGGQVESDRIDWAGHAEWREKCAAQGLVFNGLFNESSNIDESLKHVYIAGRAQRVSSGARVSVAMDSLSEPVMMFGAGNIIKDSFELTYLPFEDRINDLEITYFNEDDRYKQASVRITNDAALARGEPLKSSTISLKGVTNTARAMREGVFRMNYNRLVHRTATWESSVEAVNCTVGDVVLLQHEMPDWNVGGRIASGSTSTIMVLDRPVTLNPGQAYSMLVHQDARQLSTVSITGQSASLVTVNAAVSASARRLLVAGQDFAITRVIPSGGVSQLLLSSEAGQMILTGQSAQIWTTDVIHEATVVNSASESSVTTDRITLSAPLPFVPQAFANFMFGPTTTLRKQFRITRVGREQSGIVALTGIEYVPELYNDNPFDSPFSSQRPNITGNVRNLIAEEILVAAGGITRSIVRATWVAPLTGIYLKAIVQVSINGSAFYNHGETTGFSYEFEGRRGDVIIVRVVAVHEGTGPVPASVAPQATVNVQGVTSSTNAPTSFVATGGFRMITLTWVNPPDFDFAYTEVWEGETSNFASAVRIANISADNYLRSGLGVNVTRHYWIRAMDVAGNPSSFVGPSEATTTFLDDPDFENGIVSLFQEQNLFAIRDVTSLPATGTTVGEKVFNRTDGRLYSWDGTTWAPLIADVGTVDFADVTGTVTEAQIAANAVTQTKIADGSISTPKMVAGAVQASTIASGAVTADKIAANAVVADKIAANAVTAAKIAAGTITGDRIAANTITGGLIAASGVITNSAQINDGLITNAKITNAAVTTLKIGNNQITNDLYYEHGQHAILNGSWHTVFNVGIPAASGGSAVAFFQVETQNTVSSNGWRGFNILLRINGIDVFFFPYNANIIFQSTIIRKVASQSWNSYELLAEYRFDGPFGELNPLPRIVGARMYSTVLMR